MTVKEDEETFHRINIFREMQFDKKQDGLSIRFNEKSEQQHSLVIVYIYLYIYIFKGTTKPVMARFAGIYLRAFVQFLRVFAH